MKQGIIRPVDKMGRVVIPKEYRMALEVENEKDSFDIFIDGDKIILKKHHPACIFCNEMGPSITYGDHNVCVRCIERMTQEKEKIK